MEKNTRLINGDTWYDTDGNVLHAHGGHMLYWEGQWYWYGENRTENRYVSVYRSEDLLNWTFCPCADYGFTHSGVSCEDGPEAENSGGREDQCGASKGALQ